jgi:hypothetical protein
VGSCLLIGELAFTLLFEVCWGLLGVFLEPAWALPLLTLYGTFIVQNYLWISLIYNTLSSTKDEVRGHVLAELVEETVFDNFGVGKMIKTEVDKGLESLLKSAGIGKIYFCFEG